MEILLRNFFNYSFYPFKRTHLCNCGIFLGPDCRQVDHEPLPNFLEISSKLHNTTIEALKSGKLLKINPESFKTTPPKIISTSIFEPVTRQSIVRIFCENPSCSESFLLCTNDYSIYFYTSK